MKTLEQIEPRIAIPALPYTISEPGAYYLTQCLSGVSGSNGVTIVVSDVTLDLNGYALTGGAGTLDGVSVPASGGALHSITICNGSLHNWGDSGTDLENAVNCIIRDVHAVSNGVYGIHAGGGSTLIRCAAYTNGSFGIRCDSGSTVSFCTSHNNASRGMSLGDGSSISYCASYANVGDGLYVGPGCTVMGCAFYDNGGKGLDASAGCTIATCTAAKNDSDGFYVGGAGTIAGCTARYNDGDGIETSGKCLVIDNTCSDNGAGANDGAGIHVTAIGNGSRIERNNVANNDRGIDVDAAGNLVIRNSVTGNTTDFSITGTQTIGPIVTDTGTISNSNPWANFSF